MFGKVGDPCLQGIIPRTVEYMFAKINTAQPQNQSKYVVSLAFVQLYLESIYDLIEPSNRPNVRESPETGVYIEGVRWVRVGNVNECCEVIVKAEKNRKTFSTKMNVNSSRSHALLIARVEKVNVDTDTNGECVLTQSNLFLVDLAGSERVKKSCVKKMRLEEAKKINLSLLELGNCIQALVDNKTTHINYRNSKLTRILQESLGGNAKTTLIVNISPALMHLDETLSSLNFGLRAMKVQNKPMINNIQDAHTECTRCQREYQVLLAKYSQLQTAYEALLNANGHLTHHEQCEYSDSNRTESTSKEQHQEEKAKEGMNADNDKSSDGATTNGAIQLKQLMNDISVLNENKLQSEKIIHCLKEQITELKEQVQQMNNEYSTAITEHKALVKTVDDYKKQLQHAKSNCMKQKEANEINATKIDSLTCYIKNIESKFANRKSKAVQTDSVLTQDNIDILLQLKIPSDDLKRNDFNTIISQLILNIDNTAEQARQYQFKLKQIARAVDDERDKLKAEQEQKNEEIRLYKHKLKAVHGQLNKQTMSTANNSITNVDELISPYKAKESQLKQQIVGKDKMISALQLENEHLHSKINELDTSLNTINMNEHSYKTQIKKLQQTISKAEKDLSQIIRYIKDDVSFFSKFSKRIEKIDAIMDKELLVASSLRDIEHSVNKLKREVSKGIDLRNAFLNPEQLRIKAHTSSDSRNSYLSLESAVDHLEQLGDSNREIAVIMSGYQTKLIELFAKYIKQYNRFKSKQNADDVVDDVNGGKYDVNVFMSKVQTHFKKLTQCFKGVNADDLVEQLCAVGNGSCEWELMVVEKVMEEFIERAEAFKEDKQQEVELLNEKVEFLLRELCMYRQLRVSFSQSCVNSNRMSELSLKIEENNTLHSHVQELQNKNGKLRNELLALKSELNNAVIQITKYERTCSRNRSMQRNHSVDLIHGKKNQK